MKKNIAFKPLYLCNWSCEYCSVNNRKLLTSQPNIDTIKTLEIIEYYFSKYGNDFSYILSGGEPGLLERQWLSSFMELLVEYNINDIILQTNGTIFNHSYIDFSLFSEIQYHCIPYVRYPYDIKFNDFDDFNNLTYVVVLFNDDNNELKIDDIYNFITKNYKVFKRHKLVVKLDVSVSMCTEFVVKIKELFKIINSSGFIDADFGIGKYKNITYNNRIECMTSGKNTEVLFDRDILSMCCRTSYDINTISLPLTFENIDLLAENRICIYDERCKDCKRLVNLWGK